MKGLILKDILTIRPVMKTYFVILSFFTFLGIVSKSSFFTSFYCVFASMLPIAAMGYDERSKFNPYALTMPITLQDIVFSKYILGLLIAAIASLFSFIVALFDKTGSLPSKIVISILWLLMSIVFQAIITPIMFKCGVENGRIILVLIFIIPSVLISPLSKFWPNLLPLLHKLPIEGLVITGILAIILLYIFSIIISIKIVQKKVW